MTAQIVAKLHKTAASINAHIQRTNGGYGLEGLNKRSLVLIDRYNDLKQALINNGGTGNPAWVSYCATSEASPQHDGYDLFA